MRRLQFYRSEGAELVDAPYFQPALHGDGGRVPHLLLMAFAIAPACRRGDSIDAAPVRCFVERNLIDTERRIGGPIRRRTRRRRQRRAGR